ncbi:hypothetical protein [Mycolicibacterium sp. YH-1]|nr:hypothetical protein [Mycolicibacterium sp. YH-1]
MDQLAEVPARAETTNMVVGVRQVELLRTLTVSPRPATFIVSV